MIKTIIFDFGDVFINLDKKGTIERAKDIFGYDIISEQKGIASQSISETNDAYETGKISTEAFIHFYTKLAENVSSEDLIHLWNGLIKDFPKHRLEFIKQLKEEQKYKLILLSNTNELHINHIIEHVPFYEEFKACFDAFYLSHEIGYRKPNEDIYRFVLSENKLIPEECLFIDDTKQNTEAASKLGIHTWNINETIEDVVNLFKAKSELF
ncbi:MAG: HAD family phosphatase [Winogradskyella sp.]